MKLVKVIGAVGVVLLAAAGVGCLVLFFAAVRHWAAIHTGTLNEPGVYYGFWSGFGSDLGEYTVAAGVLGSIFVAAKRLNCHDKGCLSVFSHKVEGTPFRACHKHHPVLSKHPKGGITAEIMAVHHAEVEARHASVTKFHEEHARILGEIHSKLHPAPKGPQKRGPGGRWA